MFQIKSLQNPFTVMSPEDMTPEDTVSLFVDVFSDFPKVRDPGHAFLHGPRGSGKSMMFRYLLPDCQIMATKARLQDLPFLAIYLPIKSTYLMLSEFQRLEGRHADAVINEHFMVMHFAVLILDNLSKLPIESETTSEIEAVKTLLNGHFFQLLSHCGWNKDQPAYDPPLTIPQCFQQMKQVCLEIYGEIKLYLKSLSTKSPIVPYDGPLCGYLDFLFPLLDIIHELSFMPKGPIYLLIDDADELSEMQTRILNSWVATRTSFRVSLKISTRHLYKTYYTVTGTTIDTPHDYSEVNISTVYTSSIKGKYMDRIREIVQKRFITFDIGTTPEEFFPPDAEQEKKIRAIANELKEKWEAGEGRGNRSSDDVTRYSRPDFMKSLAGKSKSSSSYSYAGFHQLVHISSGIVRYFLDAASQMYNETLAQEGKVFTFIPPGIQSSVVRIDADRFLFGELDKIAKDSSDQAPGQEKVRKLSNLIQTLGSLFRAVLVSDRSERRVFSIAFSDAPTEEITDILRLGTIFGYFHESTIGRKNSVTGGRTKLYILSRRLAPFFNLDPTSFAGYLFVTSKFIEQAMIRPETVLHRIRRNGLDKEFEPKQLSLFEDV